MVLSGITASFLPGKRYMITGPSGAGKSMLALSLAGLVGEIRGGKPAGSLRYREVMRSIVFQNPFLQMFHTTVYDEIASSLRNNPGIGEAEGVENALGLFGIAHCVDRDIFSLSAGERKRVCLAAAAASKPELLILDEPTGYLDREGIETLVSYLASLAGTSGNTTVILFDHRCEPFMSLLDDFILLADGGIRLVCSPRDVRSHSGVFRSYGIRFPWKTEDVRITLPGGGRTEGGLPKGSSTRSSVSGGSEGKSVSSVPRGDPSPTHVGTEKPCLSAKNISAGYGGRRVIHDIDIDIFPGEITALLGENGSGKTTLAMVLAGVKRKSRGSLRLKRGMRRIMMFQGVSDQLICKSVEEEVRYGLDSRDDLPLVVQEVMERLDLTSFGSRNSRNLSIGEQHRVLLAALLAAEPDLLILDEPALGLDWGRLEGLFGCLRELTRRNRAIIIATHDDKVVCRYADRVLRLEEGSIGGDDYTRFAESGN
jgi:energy-coupling factor transport system ATP-binding protein